MLTCLPDYLCVCLHIRMSACLCVNDCMSISVCLHFCISISASACLHLLVCACLCVCMTAYMYMLCTRVCVHDRVSLCMSACLCDCLPEKHNLLWDGANNGGLTCCITLLADLWSCCPHIKVLLFLITIWLKLDMNLRQKMENYHLQEKLK